MSLEEWCVAVGQVRTVHGLRGEVKVLPLCDDPGRFRELGEVCVAFADGRRRMASIRQVAIEGKDVRLAFDGVEDRAAAEEFRHATLLIRRDMRRELDEGRYYLDDLVGLRVETTDGRQLGVVREVLCLPANDVYVTEHALIPAVREIVRSVDLEARRIVVEPLPGLAPELGL